MNRLSRSSVASMVLCATFALPLGLFPNSVEAATVPRGYKLVSGDKGVQLYYKRRDYVHVLRPSQGARLRILHDPVLEQGTSYAVFPRKAVSAWWSQWSAEAPGAFSVVNGQFFDTSDSVAAPLAFSIKKDGLVYEGYADQTEFKNQKRMLLLSDDRYSIVPYDDNVRTLGLHATRDIVVGLAPNAAKTATRPMPRTFIGITRTGEAVIFSSSMASQNYATRVLRMFGAEAHQIVMLDGGNSSHLLYSGRTLVPTDARGKAKAGRELLPQMLGIEAGSAVAAE